MVTPARDSLDICGSVLGLVLPEDRKRCNDRCRTLRVVVLDHNTTCDTLNVCSKRGSILRTENFHRIKQLELLRTPGNFSTRKPPIVVLQAEHDVYSAEHALN